MLSARTVKAPCHDALLNGLRAHLGVLTAEALSQETLSDFKELDGHAKAFGWRVGTGAGLARIVAQRRCVGAGLARHGSDPPRGGADLPAGMPENLRMAACTRR